MMRTRWFLLATSLSLGLVLGYRVQADGPTNTGQAHQPRVDNYGDPLPRGALARMGTRRFRHSPMIDFVAFRRKDSQVVSAGWDDTVRIWDRATGQVVHCFSQRFRRDAVSPDGKTLAIGGRQEVLLRDIDTGTPLRRIKTKAGIAIRPCPIEMAFSRDGQLLATADEQLQLWDIGTGRRRWASGGNGETVGCLLFSQKGDRIFGVTGQGKTVNLRSWDVITGKQSDLRRGLEQEGALLSLSRDDKQLAYAWQNQVVILELASGKEVRLQILGRQVPEAREIRQMAFNPDGTILLTADSRSIRFWNVREKKEFRLIQQRGLRCMALSEDGKLLVTGSGDGVIRLWDSTTGRQVGADNGPAGSVYSVAFSPDGSTLATAQCGDDRTRLWDVATGKERLQLVDSEAQQVAFSPDGKSLATIEPEGRELTAKEHGAPVCLWDMRSGKPLRLLAGETGENNYLLAFSADGSRLVTGRETGISLWQVKTGRQISHLRAAEVDLPLAAFCPSTGVIARARSTSTPEEAPRWGIELWDGSNNEPLLCCGDQPVSITAVALSQEGWLVAAARANERIYLYDAITGQEFRCLNGVASTPGCLTFAPGGRILASGSTLDHQWNSPKGIHFWDVDAGILTGDADAGSSVRSLAFSPDGKQLASGLHDGGALVWDVSALLRPPKGPAPLMDDDLLRFWQHLGEAEGAHAFDALCRLASQPKTVVPFLERRLAPIPEPDTKHLNDLIADLGSDVAVARRAAYRELARVSGDISPLFRAALNKNPPPATRRLLEALLQESWYANDAETLRRVRAVWVLERINSPAARLVLTKIASGWSGARETRYAKAALVRVAAPPQPARQPAAGKQAP
jgi:WD40 repeat protein